MTLTLNTDGLRLDAALADKPKEQKKPHDADA